MQSPLVLDAQKRAVEAEQRKNDALRAAGFTVTNSKVTEQIARNALKAAGFTVTDSRAEIEKTTQQAMQNNGFSTTAETSLIADARRRAAASQGGR